MSLTFPRRALLCALMVPVLAALFLAPALAQTPAPSGTVFTIAGNGTQGFSGEWRPGHQCGVQLAARRGRCARRCDLHLRL
jgi:hypothetical protein